MIQADHQVPCLSSLSGHGPNTRPLWQHSIVRHRHRHPPFVGPDCPCWRCTRRWSCQESPRHPAPGHPAPAPKKTRRCRGDVGSGLVKWGTMSDFLTGRFRCHLPHCCWRLVQTLEVAVAIHHPLPPAVFLVFLLICRDRAGKATSCLFSQGSLAALLFWHTRAYANRGWLGLRSFNTTSGWSRVKPNTRYLGHFSHTWGSIKTFPQVCSSIHLQPEPSRLDMFTRPYVGDPLDLCWTTGMSKTVRWLNHHTVVRASLWFVALRSMSSFLLWALWTSFHGLYVFAEIPRETLPKKKTNSSHHEFGKGWWIGLAVHGSGQVCVLAELESEVGGKGPRHTFVQPPPSKIWLSWAQSQHIPPSSTGLHVAWAKGPARRRRVWGGRPPVTTASIGRTSSMGNRIWGDRRWSIWMCIKIGRLWLVLCSFFQRVELGGLSILIDTCLVCHLCTLNWPPSPWSWWGPC